MPAPEQPVPGKQHVSRDYLVSREEFMRVAGLTEDGYQLMKLRGEGPREVVRLREEVFVVMRDMLEWNAQRNGNERDGSGHG